MAQKKNSKGQSRKVEGKTAPTESKNGRRTEGGAGGGAGGGPKYSMLTWLVVLGLLGVWSSVAVLYLDVVDYESVIGKLTAYDTDGDGDFDVEDAKVLLGVKSEEKLDEGGSPDPAASQTSHGAAEATNQGAAEPGGRVHASSSQPRRREAVSVSGPGDVESEIQAAVRLPSSLDDGFVPDDDGDVTHAYEEEVDSIDTVGVLLEDPAPEEPGESGPALSSSEISQEPGAGSALHRNRLQTRATPPSDAGHASRLNQPDSGAEAANRPEPEPAPEPEPESGRSRQTEAAAGTMKRHADEALRDRAKKKKKNMLNKFDKTIKSELDAAEKLRKKGRVEEALKAFESLVQQFPPSPRARYGKAQAEDDLAEKQRSNDVLQRAIATYREAAELPGATPDLQRAALKRRAERQQFLGRMRGSLATLERLVQMFPEDIGLKNDLGVAHLLLGDNKGARKVYEEVLEAEPNDGFAKVHYGFILKSENRIAESIPFLKEGLESGAPGTDDGRFYFHLGDALQRVGDPSAYDWYERGHRRGHFASVWQRSLYNVKGLRAQPWWTPRETGYTDLVKTLERNWRTIRDEALAVMDAERGRFVPEEENLRETGEWGQYTLWQQGKKVGTSCQGVPKTCALLERFPEATGCKRGQIKFSVMQPGTHVWPHTGPTNCRLRMHLGLVVPRPGCRIRCTNQTREWEEGAVLIFDDSFEHEVWQDAGSYRLILIVDVWHPELTQYQRQTLSPI